MKIIAYLVALIVITGCDSGNGIKERANQTLNDKDTIFQNDVLMELKGKYKGYQSTLDLKLSDENGKILSRIPSGVFNINVLYHSDKFPELNNSYLINIVPVTKNFALKRSEKNKFEVSIKPDADTIIFDIYLGSKKYIFMSSYIDKEKLKHRAVPEIGLSRKTIILPK